MSTKIKNIGGAELLKRFQEKLTNGQRAEIRRAIKPDDLALMPGFYRLLEGDKAWPGYRRVIFVLPFVSHIESDATLGAALCRAGISETRLFQVVRSNEPNDLQQLRRLLQQSEPQVNFNSLAKKLIWWDKSKKQRIIEDFYSQLYQNEKEGKI